MPRVSVKPHYAGIGSRETPNEICALMTILGEALAERYVLRSGHAVGADIAFEVGCDRAKGEKLIWTGNSEVSQAALDLAKRVHPSEAFDEFSLFVKTLHARNGYQVLNEDLCSPVEMVICWTPDGCIEHKRRTRRTGGTGQAISVASLNGVRIFNIQREAHRFELYDYLKAKGIDVPALISGLNKVPEQHALF